jgi:hypothetical protein
MIAVKYLDNSEMILGIPGEQGWISNAKDQNGTLELQ